MSKFSSLSGITTLVPTPTPLSPYFSPRDDQGLPARGGKTPKSTSGSTPKSPLCNFFNECFSSADQKPPSPKTRERHKPLEPDADDTHTNNMPIDMAPLPLHTTIPPRESIKRRWGYSHDDDVYLSHAPTSKLGRIGRSPRTSGSASSASVPPPTQYKPALIQYKKTQPTQYKRAPLTQHKKPPISSKAKSKKRRKWSPAEDDMLRSAVATLGRDAPWSEIAELVPGRTGPQVAQRWRKTVRPELQNVVFGPWSFTEDEKLISLVGQHGSNGMGVWETVACGMGYTRNPKQCRERWTGFLDPSLKIGEWTDEEDARLLHLCKQYGKRWSKIAKQMPGRTADRIKRRFHVILYKTSL